MRSTGGQTGLTKAKIKQFCDALRQGNYIETACALVGYRRIAFYEWLKCGANAKDKPPSKRTKHEKMCIHLSNAAQKALAEGEARDIALIDAAAHGMPEERVVERYERDPTTGELILMERTKTQTTSKSWQAAAWRRERREPQKWGRRRIEVAPPIEEVEIEWLDDEDSTDS